MFTNKQIAQFYFKHVLDEQDEPITAYYRCRCSLVRQQAPRTGWSNLAQHVKTQHPDYAEVMGAAAPGATGTLVPWIRQSSLNLFGWMQWTVKGNLPLHFCEDPETRRYTKLDPISEELLLRGMNCVMRYIIAQIKTDMPTKFGLLLDGWSFDSEHYLAVFGCFEKNGRAYYPLLAMVPLISGVAEDHSATSHVAFLREMLLRDYNRQLDSCLFVVGDNCATNQRMATLMGVPLVGCASHRLNLAVRLLFEEYEDDLAQVKSLMTKLKGLNQSAKLRGKTPLRPVLSQATRWSSTFAMVHRYFRLLEFIADDDELADHLPSAAANRRLRKLLDDLTKIESVSKELQSSSVSLLDARVYFDGLVELQPAFASYLDSRASIIHSPQFETACVKVLGGKADELNRAEAASLRPFLVQDSAESVPSTLSSKPNSFVEEMKKRRKMAQAAARYELIPFIPPTSNLVERFFSLAKVTLGTQRHSLLPATLEMILFLRVNDAFWNAQVVNECT